MAFNRDKKLRKELIQTLIKDYTKPIPIYHVETIRDDYIKKHIEILHKFPNDFTFLEMQDFIEKIDNEIALSHRYNSPLGVKPVIHKGIMDGEKFDSKWEAIVWIYYKKIKMLPIERNHVEYLLYVDEYGKQRHFYPDFKVAGEYIEVKGRYRPSDIKKMEQHPEVQFIDATNITKLKKEVDKLFPNWEEDYIFRN